MFCLIDFKQFDFKNLLSELFNSMSVNFIEIYNQIDKYLSDDSPDRCLSSMLIYYTSGLKPKVKENNLKSLV